MSTTDDLLENIRDNAVWKGDPNAGKPWWEVLWEHSGEKDVVEAVGGWAGNKAMEWFAELIEGLVDIVFTVAAWLLSSIWNIASTAAAPDLGWEVIQEWAGMIFFISVPIVAIFAAAQTLSAMFKGNFQEFGRIFTGMIYAIIGTTLSLPFVDRLQQGFDLIADALMDGAFDRFGDGADGMAESLLIGNPGSLIVAGTAGVAIAIGTAVALQMGVGVILGVLGSLLATASFGLFMALQIRTVLLYVIVVIGPIMLAGAAWRKTASWAIKYCSIVLALVFTKLGVVIVFGLGISMISQLPTDDADLLSVMGHIASATLMLGLAVFVPFACFKFFNFLGEDLVTTLSDSAKGLVDKGSSGIKRAGQMALNPTNAATALGVGGALAQSGGSPDSNVIGQTADNISETTSTTPPPAENTPGTTAGGTEPTQADTTQETSPTSQQPLTGGAASPKTSGTTPATQPPANSPNVGDEGGLADPTVLTTPPMPKGTTLNPTTPGTVINPQPTSPGSTSTTPNQAPAEANRVKNEGLNDAVKSAASSNDK